MLTFQAGYSALRVEVAVMKPVVRYTSNGPTVTRLIRSARLNEKCRATRTASIYWRLASLVEPDPDRAARCRRRSEELRDSSNE